MSQLKQLIFEAREQRDGSIVILAPDGTITVAKRDQPEMIGQAIMDGLDNPPETQTSAAPPRAEARGNTGGNTNGNTEDQGGSPGEPTSLEDAILGTILEHAPGAAARLLNFGRKISYQGDRKED